MGGGTFGRDTLQHPRQPPQISAGSSSKREILFFMQNLGQWSSHPGEGGSGKFHPGVGNIHCISHLWEILLYILMNTSISLEGYFFIFWLILLYLWRDTSTSAEKYFMCQTHRCNWKVWPSPNSKSTKVPSSAPGKVISVTNWSEIKLFFLGCVRYTMNFFTHMIDTYVKGVHILHHVFL